MLTHQQLMEYSRTPSFFATDADILPDDIKTMAETCATVEDGDEMKTIIIDNELDALENVVPMKTEDEDNNDSAEGEVIVVEKKYSHTEAAAAMDLLKTYLLSHQFSTETHLSLNTLQRNIQKEKLNSAKKEPSISSFFSKRKTK